MAEGSYEYECMRAELLGTQKPDYDEFMKRKEAEAVEEEELDLENLKEVQGDNEKLKGLSGGLEELNTILQSTQRHLNKFKASCGSFTNILKSKLGQGGSSTPPPSLDEQFEPQPQEPETNGCNSNNIKSDLAKALDHNVDKLDSLLDSAENATYSMQHQNKQMRKFLK